MGRKAKRPKNGTSQKEERPEKTKLSKKRNSIKENNLKSESYSFTKPVVRVSDAAKKESGLRDGLRLRKDASPKPHLVVFHKREDKTKQTDIIGTRGLC